MANTYAYVRSTQIFAGDFVFAFTIDSANFGFGTGGLQSWGVIPAAAVLTASGSVGGQVQTAYPDRPFFSLDGSGNVLAMGVSAAVSKTNGDIFSIHRAGSVVRFYKNPQSSVVPRLSRRQQPWFSSGNSCARCFIGEPLRR